MQIYHNLNSILGETGIEKSNFWNYIIGEEKFLIKKGRRKITTKIDGYINKKESYKYIKYLYHGFQGTQYTEL